MSKKQQKHNRYLGSNIGLGYQNVFKFINLDDHIQDSDFNKKALKFWPKRLKVQKEKYMYTAELSYWRKMSLSEKSKF